MSRDPDATAPTGGSNAVTPAGGSHPSGRRAAEPTNGEKERDNREDPARGFEGGRSRPSPAAAAQEAREQANVDTASGYDEGDAKQIPPDAPLP